MGRLNSPNLSASPAVDVLIEAHGIEKVFAPELSLATLLPGSQGASTWALRDIDLTIHRGETVALLGSNGSGKSTLLRLLAGTLQPSAGSLEIRGSVGGIIDLMGGLHPDLSGQENIRLQGNLLGLSGRQMDRLQPEIEAFSELSEEDLRLPVRTYSLGMLLRLGFSVAIHTEPDIFIIDEALAVGDGYFQWKCLREIRRLRERGGTLLFVSHLPDQAEALCERAIWLERGRIVMDGPSGQVAPAYHAHLSEELLGSEPLDADQALAALTPQIRVGSGKAVIQSVEFFGPTGSPSRRWVQGQPARVRLTLEARQPISKLGVALATELVGQPSAMAWSPDLGWTPDLSQGTHLIELAIPRVTMAPGHYYASVAIHENAAASDVLDSHMKGHSLTVEAPPDASPVPHQRLPSILYTQPVLLETAIN